MPRRTDISSVLVIGAGLLLTPAPPSASAQPAGLEWTIDCSAGHDGFAANCIATRPVGNYTLKLQTADSQVFVSILHPACETNYRNFDRTDLILLDPAERRALMARAFHEISDEIGRTCPSLVVTPAEPETIPDIAILSPDMDH